MKNRLLAAEAAFSKKIQDERRRRSQPHFFHKLLGEMVFCPAFNEITKHSSAVAVLIHVLFRQAFPPKAKDRKKLEKAGLWPPKKEVFSFPYREARHHGMTEKALVAGLAALHRVGYIDRLHPGSGKRGDFARYIQSDRWRNWGRPDFKELPWEKATSIGRRDSAGKFMPSRASKSGAHKSFVAAESAATEKQTTAKSAATQGTVAAESAANKPPLGIPVAAKSAVFLSLPSSDIEGSEKKVPKVSDPEFNVPRRAAAVFHRDEIHLEYPWAEDEQMVMTFDGSEATH